MSRTFEMKRSSGTKLAGIVFEDGSVAVRQLHDDPCARITFTFEGISECEAELGIRVPGVEIPPLLRARLPEVVDNASSKLERRLIESLFAPCHYTAEDNDPEPEDVFA